MNNIGVFLILSIAALQFGVGIWLTLRYLRFKRSAKKVLGTTLDPDVIGGSFDSPSYELVIEYYIESVRYVVRGGGISGCKRCHRKDRNLWVYYPPNQPDKGKVLEWWEPVVRIIPIVISIYLVLLVFFGRQAA